MAAQIFPFGTALTVVWHLTKPDGTSFDLSGYTYRVYYRTGNKETEVNSQHLDPVRNNLWISIPASEPVAPGEYAMRLVLYQNGNLFCTINYNAAFVLSRRFGAEALPTENQEEAGQTVHLFTVAEFYLLQPVIPTIGLDKNWYVNGVIVTDSHGDYVSAEHTVRYDEDTKCLIIDEGRVDSRGQSIQQTITDVATALADWEASYVAAEGSSSSSVAGDGSRWGAYKSAEAVREENETARKDAEGTPSDAAGTNTRWGAEKQRQLNETARQNAEGASSDEAGANTRWGAEKQRIANETARQIAEGTSGDAAGANTRWGAEKQRQLNETARQEAEGTPDDDPTDPEVTTRWAQYKRALAATERANEAAAAAEHQVDVKRGYSIESVTQPVVSTTNGGVNTIRVTTEDNKTFDFYVRNGKSSAGFFSTATALNTAIPSPNAGDYAFVSEAGDGTFPAYIYVCTTAGTWTATEAEYDGDSVDLTPYATKEQVDQLLIELVAFAPTGSQDFDTVEVGQVVYNTTSKLLRKRTGSTTWVTVPYYDGAIYTYNGDLYTWDGDNLITRGKDVDDLELFRNAVMSNFRSRKEKTSGTTYTNVSYITGLNIAQSEKINLRFDSSSYTRLIVNYNGNNSLRLKDTTEDYRGKWFSVVAPANITSIGLYVEGLTAETELGLSIQYGIFFLPDKSVGAEKIAERAVGYENFGTSAREKTLPVFRTGNLYDEREKIDGKYLNNNGAVMSATGWAMSPLIPVVVGKKYTISCSINARNTGFRWCDASGATLSTDGSIFTTHTAPTDAVYMQFNVAASGSYSTDIMVAEGATVLPFVPYLQTETQYIKDFAEDVRSVTGSGRLTVTKNGNTLTVANPDGAITAKLENNAGSIYSYNPVFNFTGFSFSGLSNTGSDDIAPMHILNTTIGANHGQPCKKAKITAHGLDNTAIGTGWTIGGVTFYVMRIVDENNIIFLSENSGTLASPSFTALTAGTIERSGDTLTVESVTDSQLVPALKNHTLKLMLNGNKEITADGVYSSKTFDVVEEYDIMNPVSTLQKIIARAGQSEEPEYDGDSAIRVKNIYRFDVGLSVLVITTVIPMQEVKLSDIMFSQAAQIQSGNKNYIPNSLPLGSGNYDFRKPLAVSWSSSVPPLAVTESQMADEDNPVNRVVQYNETKGVGFALGFLRGFGVGKDLLSYTGTTFEIRNNTGKIYPHGVTSAKVGDTIDQDNVYQAVMYRSPFVFTSLSSGRMSMYHFAFDGAEYVFLDYASTMVDNVLVDASLNGKKIEVVEAVNTELVTDIYNDGFLVKATYVEGETCYLVAKI